MNILILDRKWLHALIAATLILVYYTALAELPRGAQAILTVDCYWIEDASIVDVRANEGTYGIANVGHQIAQGNNVVLSIREYDDADRGPDSQAFKKLTLEFRPLSGPRKTGSEQGVRVVRSYYSEGSPAFLHKGWYDWASSPVSSFKLLSGKGDTQAKVNATFDAKNMRDGSVKRQQVTWTCPVIKLAVSQLNAWQGRPGTDDDSFNPPLN